MKTLSVLLILMLCNPVFGQGVLVPTFDDLPTPYDDTELRKRVEAIEEALNKLGNTTPPPPGEEPLPPVGPDEPEVPTDPPASGEYPSYEAALQHPALLNSFDFRSQDGINRRSVNAKKGEDPINNENVVYDPEHDAAKIITSGSIELYNRVAVHFGQVTTGHLVWVWDYKPSSDWDQNNVDVSTHKMFMAYSTLASDRRMLEQRFHYHRDGRHDGRWEVDMRPYVEGANTKGPGSGLDRLTPYLGPAWVNVDEWTRFINEVDFTGKTPVYSLRFKRQDGEVVTLYDRAALDRLVTVEKGLNGFDPTWANTSQDKSTAGPFVHGHLRNVYVLHSDEPIDLQPILEAEIE